jgi:Transposase, Mutator family
MILGVLLSERTKRSTHRWPLTSLSRPNCSRLQIGRGLDLIRESVRLFCQELIETELSALIGAESYDRSEDRTGVRNENRSRVLTTKAGDVELAIPKLRRGSFFPSVLERRRRIGSVHLLRRGCRKRACADHFQSQSAKGSCPAPWVGGGTPLLCVTWVDRMRIERAA